MSKILILILIVATTLLIATIVINIINVEKCKNAIIPSYNDLKDGLTDVLTYKSQLHRFTAESIVKYKLELFLSTGTINSSQIEIVKEIDPAKLLDYAIHIILFTDILYTNTARLKIITHPKYTEAINGYSNSEFKFRSSEKKDIAIEVLGITDTTEKVTYRNMPDNQIYILLTTGYKIAN